MSPKTLIIELYGHREAEYDGKRIKVPEAKGVVPIVCRDALENGYEPDSVVEVYRRGLMSFLPQPLQQWADISIHENAERISVRPYTPFDLTHLTDQREDT